MIRTTLDTNIVISGILGFHRPASPPGEIVRRWHGRQIRPITSVPLIAEAQKVLWEPYFAARLAPADRDFAMWLLTEQSILTPMTIKVSGVASHPEDDIVLATAASGNADYLVTGDHDLLRLRQFHSVVILSPAEFLSRLDQDTSRF